MSKGQEDLIAGLVDALAGVAAAGGKEAQDEQEETQPPVSQAAEVQPPAEPVGEGADSEEEVAEEDEGETAEGEEPEAEGSEIQELKAQVAALIQANQELMEKLKPPVVEEEEPQQQATGLPEMADVNFVENDDQLYKVTNESGEFNKMMNSVVKGVRERLISEISPIVGSVVDQRIAIYKAYNTFYATNRDLFEEHLPDGSDPNNVKNARLAVFQNLVQEVQGKHPDWALRAPEKVLDEAGKRLRNALGQVKKQEAEQVKRERVRDRRAARPPQRSPFAQAPGARTARPAGKQPPTVADEVDSLQKVLGL